MPRLASHRPGANGQRDETTGFHHTLARLDQETSAASLYPTGSRIRIYARRKEAPYLDFFSLSISPGREDHKHRASSPFIPAVHKLPRAKDVTAKKWRGDYFLVSDGDVCSDNEGESKKKGGPRVFLGLSETSCTHISCPADIESGVYVFCAVLILSCLCVLPVVSFLVLVPRSCLGAR